MEAQALSDVIPGAQPEQRRAFAKREEVAEAIGRRLDIRRRGLGRHVAEYLLDLGPVAAALLLRGQTHAEFRVLSREIELVEPVARIEGVAIH